MRGVRNGAAEDDGHWDLKPRRGSYRKEDHVVLGCFFLPRGLGSRRDFAKKKRVGRTLAGGP